MTAPCTFDAPRSICVCGHTGDGPHSDHLAQCIALLPANEGHGQCSIHNCRCTKFTWTAHTAAYLNYCAEKFHNVP